MNQLDLELAIDPEALMSGQVIIDVRISNVSSSTVVLLPWNTPLDASVSGHFYRIEAVRGGASHEIPYVGKMVKRMAPTAQDFVTLETKETLVNRQDVTKSYRFCADTNYILSFSGELYNRDYESLSVEKSDLAFTLGSAFPDC